MNIILIQLPVFLDHLPILFHKLTLSFDLQGPFALLLLLVDRLELLDEDFFVEEHLVLFQVLH